MNDTRILAMTWDRRISPSARQVYAYLDGKADDTGVVSMSFSSIARALGYSRQSVRTGVHQLVNAGYLVHTPARSVSGQQLPHVYRLHVEG
jgi:hypothetical protein